MPVSDARLHEIAQEEAEKLGMSLDERHRLNVVAYERYTEAEARDAIKRWLESFSR